MGSATELSGLQKAAILCITLGPELSARLFKRLTETEMELLTAEIARTQHVSPEEQEAVLQEFQGVGVAHTYVRQGGLEYARSLLEQALGNSKAAELLERLSSSLNPRPFDVVRRTDPSQVASFIQNEHPQTIAMVMSFIPPAQAALILSGLPPDRRADVIRRAATMERTSPEMMREAEQVLERKLSALVQQDVSTAGGVEWVVEVLNRVDRQTERTIMDTLAETDPDLAEELKQRMFLFEDIVKLDDRSLQRVLREVDMIRDMPLAMKTAGEAVWKKVLANVSNRVGENLRDSVSILGPVRIRDVEEAQARIVAIVRRLEEAGEIVVSRSGADDLVL